MGLKSMISLGNHCNIVVRKTRKPSTFNPSTHIILHFVALAIVQPAQVHSVRADEINKILINILIKHVMMEDVLSQLPVGFLRVLGCLLLS